MRPCRDRSAPVLAASSLIVCILFRGVAAASAQAFVESDLVGAPLGLLETPVLTPGACYEIQVGESTPGLDPSLPGMLSAGGDPIMTIRTGQGDLDTTVAGADACLTPGGSNLLPPACTRFCMSAGVFPTARTFSIWVRSYLAAYRGTAVVRIQRTTSATDAPDPVYCTGPGAPVRDGCWSVLSSTLSFGGIAHKGAFGSTAVQMETTELPGIQAGGPLASSHIIVFAGDNDNIFENWVIAPSNHLALLGSGAPGSHRRGIAYTAQYSGPRPPAVPGVGVYTVIAAPYYSSGPFRLMQNDLVSNVTPVVGVDGDGDELGAALEAALKTCDTTATPNAGGQSCTVLPGCYPGLTTPALMARAPQCQQSMRDSDQDGIRDDIETYGVQLYSAGGAKLDGGWMARYGANPAHYDVFWEVDYSGNHVVPGGCDGNRRGPTAAVSRPEVTAMASQFASATASVFPNRDGVGGVAAHFDIGNLSVEPSVPTDTAGGDWGGSTCYLDRPLCTVDADCAGASPVAGACCRAETCWSNEDGPEFAPGSGQCLRSDPRLEWMSSARRWLFRSTGDFQNGMGGSTDIFALHGYASGPAAIVHEAGHQGGLDHGAPYDAEMGDLGAYAVNRPTIMNYAFSYVAGANLVPGGPGGADTPTRVTFSNGTRSSLRPTAVSEVGSLGSSGDYDLLQRFGAFHDFTSALTGTPRHRVFPGSNSIDFNEDGLVAPPGVTVEGRIGGGVFRLGREVIGSVLFVSEGGPEIVQVGSTMVRFRVSGSDNASITPFLTRSMSSTFNCSEYPAASGKRFPPCLFASSVATPLATYADLPVAVAADSATVASIPRAVVVYRTRNGKFRDNLFGADGTWEQRLEVTNTPSLQPLSTGAGFPSIARIGGTQNVLLTYRNVDGDVVEQVGTLTATTTTWSMPTVVVPAALAVIGSPATTTLENSTLGSNGVLLVTARNVGGVFSWEFRRRNSASPTSLPATWTLITTLPEPGDGTWGRPVIEVRPFRSATASGSPTTVDRLLLSWRSTLRRLDTMVRMSPPGSLTETVGLEWTLADVFAELNEPTAHAAEMELDTRYTLRGLRGSWSSIKRCDSGVANACPAGSSCTTFAGGISDPRDTACVSTLDGLVQATERMTPGADGVQPMEIVDFNEWPMMRYAFCSTLAAEGSTRGWAPVGYRQTSVSCVVRPTYAR